PNSETQEVRSGSKIDGVVARKPLLPGCVVGGRRQSGFGSAGFGPEQFAVRIGLDHTVHLGVLGSILCALKADGISVDQKIHPEVRLLISWRHQTGPEL